MKLSATGAARGALVGMAGMTAVMIAARRLGLTRMSIVEVEGTMVAPPRTTEAKSVGYLAHLMMSLAIGFAYAVGYQVLGWRPNWKSGLLGGLIHWSIAGLVVGMASKIHPRRQEVPMPGFYGLAQGVKTALAYLLAHLVFGSLFGWEYGEAASDNDAP